MKQQIKNWIAIPAFVLLAIGASAQTKSDTAPWASDKGYWVIETNVKTPQSHTIRFYNNSDVLIYTEKVEGVRLNAERKKIKMKLKEVLETSVIAWEKSKTPTENKNYVTAVLR